MKRSYVNEESPLLNQGFQCRGGAIDLIDDNEEDDSETVLNARIDRRFDLIEDETGEKSQKDGHDDLREDHGWISNGISKGAKRNVVEIVQWGTREEIIWSLAPIHRQDGMSRWIVRLSIGISKDIHRCLITTEEKIQRKIGWIIVFIRLEIEGGEMRENADRRAQIDRMARREEKNGVEQFEDGVARLMDGEDDRTCTEKRTHSHDFTRRKINTHILVERDDANTSLHFPPLTNPILKKKNRVG